MLKKTIIASFAIAGAITLANIAMGIMYAMADDIRIVIGG